MNAHWNWIRAALAPAIVVVAVGGGIGADATEKNMDEQFKKALAENEASLVEFRRDIHRHPELSGQEERTARVIAERMTAAGLDVRTGVGGHGVVAVLTGGSPGPVVAYRADMDAIPPTGPDPVEFASENEGARHGCGHDMHVTVAVGIAEALASVRDEMQGTVVFIFQPAEENAEGAAAVIADGAMTDPAPEAIYAVHCAPLEVGTIGSRPGMMMAGLDVAQIALSGSGDVDAAAEAVAAVFAGVNTVDMGGPVQLEAGTAFVAAGVFSQAPAEGGGTTLTAMVRCSSEEEHSEARMAVKKGVGAIDVADVTSEMEYSPYAIPAVMNDPALIQQANTVVTRVAGEEALIELDAITPFFSEDFSHFQNEVPGALYFLGVSNTEKGTMGLPHHPAFVPDEGAIVFGASTMASILWDYLEQH